jgi:hypothetical protein
MHREKLLLNDRMEEGKPLVLNIERGAAAHVSFFFEGQPGDFPQLSWRFSNDESWKSLEREVHVSTNDLWFSQLLYSTEKVAQLEVRMNKPLKEDVFLHLFYPGEVEDRSRGQVDFRSEDCECPRPEMSDRMDWCPSCPDNPAPFIHEPTHLIIHHSAGVNSSQDWPAVVRSIWDFHVNGRGWDDIGYNYLIDPNGEIYVGRGREVRGAHFCGNNNGALGVCVLGTFSTTLPTSTARNAWLSLSSWAACDWEISPLERSLHASSGLNLLGVSGHREGCSTECPGEQLYTELSEWRNLLRADMDACSEEEDSLQLSAMSSTFPYRVQLQWEGGPVNADRYLLQIRERDTGLARQKEFSGGVKQYGVDVQAGTTYEFQLLAYASPQSDFVRSNTVEWEVEEWHPDQESLFVSPNPVGKTTFDLVLTNTYSGDVEVYWVGMDARVQQLSSLRKQNTTLSTKIDRSAWSAGVYTLLLRYGDQKETLRVVLL